MREGSVGGVGSVGGNPKEYRGVLKIGFGIIIPIWKNNETDRFCRDVAIIY
ncbi:hypothetical protein [Mastigocoleus testarum]|uniref:hypothetical protein n=1 Tax=Mastigocoleus testarum TaxID=996925 RepID=UPI00137A2E7D|nr:hypothetical protein [Mastigocoleus testarum]